MPARYRELVVEAPRGWGRGFLEDWRTGCPPGPPTFDAEAEGFRPGGLGEKVEELVHPTREVRHLLVPETAVVSLRDALEEVTVRSERPLSGARFRFRTRIHSPEHALRVHARLTALPDGLVLDPDTVFEERRIPEARGLDALAPEHDFTLQGEGGVAGPLPEIVTHLRTCREEELVHVEDLELLPAR